MADSIRIRAQAKDGVALVNVLMPHRMESGLRKDESGALVAAHYITDVEIRVGDRPVLLARLSRAVSKDPLLQFRIKRAVPGARITVAWVDDRGVRCSDAALIT